MKKQVLFGGLILMMGLMMSSCERTVVDYNRWQIVDCNIGYSQWRYTGDDYGSEQYANNYFYAAYNISQLTKDIFNDGNVQVYLVETNSYGEETQRPLPFSRHKEEWNDQGVKFTYTETYDYFYGIDSKGAGWIEFNYTASDFEYEKSQGTMYRPDGKKFRVVLTW